ncbi:MAG: class I SAM-dependent methyltransferase [Pseudomonadota bacterium]
MPDSDRKKWDERYAQGAYAGRDHPSAYLVDHVGPDGTLARLGWRRGCAEPPRAADLACGRGRNARWLASQGFAVDAYDISPVGLAAAAAVESQANVQWLEHDLLETGLPPERYDLIVMVRFVAMDLLPKLREHLRPGGCLLVEEHLHLDVPWPEHVQLSGPGSQRFRTAPGALRASVTDATATVLHAAEGLVVEPDGQLAALSRILVQVPG